MAFKLVALALVAAHLATAQELMRFGCSQLSIDRIDPIVNPGIAGSPHMHQLVGGSSLNITMEPVAYDPPTLSTCTSCTYSEDFSNYWTANVYFQARNGTYKRVPQFTNLGLNVDAGMTVYYIRGYVPSKTVTAFPPVSLFFQLYVVRRLCHNQGSTLVTDHVSNSQPGLPHARWRRHQQRRQRGSARQLFPLRSQPGAESLRRPAVHRRRHAGLPRRALRRGLARDRDLPLVLGRREHGQRGPHVARGVPGVGLVREQRALPGLASGGDPAGHVRDHVRHAPVQQLGRVARGRVAAVCVEFWG